MERNRDKNHKVKVKKTKNTDNVLVDSFETISETRVKKKERGVEVIDLDPKDSDRVLPRGYADVYSSWSMD